MGEIVGAKGENRLPLSPRKEGKNIHPLEKKGELTPFTSTTVKKRKSSIILPLKEALKGGTLRCVVSTTKGKDLNIEKGSGGIMHMKLRGPQES